MSNRPPKILRSGYSFASFAWFTLMNLGASALVAPIHPLRVPYPFFQHYIVPGGCCLLGCGLAQIINQSGLLNFPEYHDLPHSERIKLKWFEWCLVSFTLSLWSLVVLSLSCDPYADDKGKLFLQIVSLLLLLGILLLIDTDLRETEGGE